MLIVQIQKDNEKRLDFNSIEADPIQEEPIHEQTQAGQTQQLVKSIWNK